MTLTGFLHFTVLLFTLWSSRIPQGDDSMEGEGRVVPGATTENRVWKCEACPCGAAVEGSFFDVEQDLSVTAPGITLPTYIHVGVTAFRDDIMMGGIAFEMTLFCHS